MVTDTVYTDSLREAGDRSAREYELRTTEVDTVRFDLGGTTNSSNPPMPPRNVVVEPAAEGALGADNASASALLDWEAPSGGGADQYNIYRSTEPIPEGTDPATLEPALTADRPPVDGANKVDSSPTLGRTYFYRLTSIGPSGQESKLSSQSRAFVYPPEVESQVDVTFGQKSRKQDYRLIALPGDPREGESRSVADVLPGDQGNWRVFWDDGTSSKFFVEYDEDQPRTFLMVAGRGFWALSTQGWSESELYPSVTLEGDSVARAGLHEGWNIVANPTGKDISWSRIQRENSFSNVPLWRFDGSFERVETMQSASSGEAYYVRNEAGKNVLKIPYPGSPPEIDDASPAQTQRVAKRPAIVLRAVQAGGDTSRAEVQFTGEAKAEFGDADVVAPTSRFSALGMRLKNPSFGDRNVDPREKYLAVERRPLASKRQVFDLALWNRTESEVRVRAGQIRGLEGREVMLAAPWMDGPVDLRGGGALRMPARRDTTNLQLLVGTEEYESGQVGQDSAPEKVRLTAYPNPVRQTATFEYTLPEAQTVRLAIYDVLGRKVRTLAHGRQTSGTHTVSFDVSGLAGGIYFCRFEAETAQLTRKVTVAK